MIQMRYEYMSAQGKTWTNWYNIEADDSKLQKLKEMYPWQVLNKLKNEFRIIDS